MIALALYVNGQKCNAGFLRQSDADRFAFKSFFLQTGLLIVKMIRQFLVSPTHGASPIDHFTVSCLVAWPLNESETGGDLVLIETSLLFSC